MDPDHRKFDMTATLQKGVSDVRSATTIDLLPSSLDLIDVQDKLASAPAGKFFSANPIELLNRAVKSRIDEYDLVIVDCPPNRSEEHTSELQSLMRISYAVFCLKKKT